jgi:hypothetical protein
MAFGLLKIKIQVGVIIRNYLSDGIHEILGARHYAFQNNV